MNLYEFRGNGNAKMRGRYLVFAKNSKEAYEKLATHYKKTTKGVKKSYTLLREYKGKNQSVFHIDLGTRLLI